MPTATYQGGQTVPSLGVGGMAIPAIGTPQYNASGAGASYAAGAASSPTVMTDANIRENVIPENNARVTALTGAPNPSQPSQPQNGSTGTATVGPNGTTVKKDYSNMSYDDIYNDVYGSQGNKDSGDPIATERSSLIKQMKERTDAQTQAQLSNIEKQYAEQERLLKQSQNQGARSTKNTLMRLGGRYDPSRVNTIVSEERTAGLQDLSDLHDKEDIAKAKVLDAQANKDYELLDKELSILENTRKEKINLATKIADQIQEENKQKRDLIVEQQKELNKNVNDVMNDASKNGAPAEVIDSIRGAKTTAEAIKAAGNYLQGGGSGIVGEYNFYKKDAISKGLVPLSFDDYQTRDANRKVSLARAGASVGGLSPATATKVQTIAGQFDNEPAVRNYQTIAESIDSVRNAGDSPTDDIQRIYAFAKIMDPNSAVKEGEYKTIEEYAQAVYQRAGKKLARVFDNQGFLTKEARGFIESTLENRLKSSEKAYNNIYDEYGRRINKVTGAKDGSEYITDYSKGFVSNKNDTIRAQQEAKRSVDDYIKTNPKDVEIVVKLYQAKDENGDPVTDEDVYDYLKMNGKIK